MSHTPEDDHQVQVLYPIDDNDLSTSISEYDDDLEKSNTIKESKPEEFDEFTFAYNQYDEFRKLNLWFKIHAGVGFTIGLISMLVWHWTRKTTHWWFIYPFSFFMFTTAVHYSIIKKNLWNIFYSFLWISNVTVVLAWATHITKDGKYPFYPVFVIFPSLILRSLVDFIRKPHNERNTFKFILSETWILSGFLFVIWAFYGGPFPWFFIPAIVLFTPIIMYRIRFIDGEKKIWPLVAIAVGMLSLLTFFIWMFTYDKYPWFPIPAIIGIPITILIARREGSSSPPPPTMTTETDDIETL